jgi:hypothetical protein
MVKLESPAQIKQAYKFTLLSYNEVLSGNHSWSYDSV